MTRVLNILLCLILLLFCGIRHGQAQDVIVYSQDFEASGGGFSHSGQNDQWQWGTPLAGPSSAHSGNYLWGTNLEGIVAYNHDATLISPAITLPSLNSNERIRASFWAWIAVDGMYDRGEFLASSNTSSWTSKAQFFYNMAGVDGWTGYASPGWHRFVFDISEFASGPVYLAFRLYTDNSDNFYGTCPPEACDGFYIDDISISKSVISSNQVIFTLEAREDPSPTASCPWVCPWSGQKYVADNDVISTARSSAQQYRDYYRLQEPLMERNNSYSLQFVERNEEHSWMDYVGLKVIDHPRGAQIEVDDKGTVVPIVNPQAPFTAVSNSGEDVMNAVRAKKGGQVALYNGDYVELTFANSGTLTQGARLALQGTGFVRGNKVNSPPFRQPGFEIQTRDQSGAWEVRGKWWPRFQQSTGGFDLTGLLPDPQGEAKVRIVSISCEASKYNALDWVGLDAGAAPSISVTDAALEQATFNGQDVVSLINTADKNYLATKSHDVYTVAFSSPVRSGDERSFIVVTDGYYLVDSTVTGKSYYIYTWDGARWQQRDGSSFPGVDAAMTFNLSSYLPDPDGEYKVRVWQDYWYEPAAIDYMGLSVYTPNEIPGTMVRGVSLENGTTTDVSQLLSSSDDNHVTFDQLQTDVSRDRWVEAKWEGFGVNNPPVVSNLDVGGQEPIYAITDRTPVISWNYWDAEGQPQTGFQIQVWTGPGGSGTNVWDTIGTNAATAIEYGAGRSLQPGGAYYARVKAFDGVNWGGWTEVLFGMYSGDTEPPMIVLTQATVDLSRQPAIEGTMLTIAAQITDNVGVDRTELYYRTIGGGQYTMATMNPIGNNIYSAVIAGGAVQSPGVQYYLLASDAVNVAYSPETNPSVYPYEIAVNPNILPVITHTPVTLANAGQNIPVTANVVDNTDYVSSVTLYYRIVGVNSYDAVVMNRTQGTDDYTGVIPGGSVTSAGVEYYIKATDNYSASSYAGRFDSPFQVTVLGGRQRPRILDFTVGAPEDPMNITNPQPPMNWTYFDSSGSPQSHYHLQVWTLPGGNGIRLWETGEVASNISTLAYAGADLEAGGRFYARLKVKDGILWSDWTEITFRRKSIGPQTGIGQTIFTGYVSVDALYAPTGTEVRAYNHRTNDFIASTTVAPYNKGKNYALSMLQGQGNVADGDAIDFKVIDGAGNEIALRPCLQPMVPTFDSAFPPALKIFDILATHPRMFSVPVVPGFNAVSWNIKPNNDSVAAVFGPLMRTKKVQVVLEFRDCAVPQSFNYYVPELGIYNPMQITDYRKGYFVKLLPGVQPDTFSVTGMPVCNYEPIPVCGGYSFVSYLPERSAAVDQALASLDWSQLNFVLKYFNPGTGEADERFQYYPAEFQQMAEGNGYFVNMTGQLGTVVDTIVYPGLFEPVSAILSGAGQKPGKGTSAAGPLRTLSSGSRLLPQIMIAYGLQVRMNGALVASGAELVAVDRNNVVCGRGRFVADGVVSLAIRADDPSTAQDEGAERGEAVSLYLNGTPMPETVRWTEFGATVQLTDLAMGAGQQEQEKPHTFRLYQNYPNPFNPMTEISYDVAEQAYVQVRVYNTLGSEVATLVERMQPAGRYTVRWDGRDGQGRPAASGVYVCKLFAGDAAAKTVNRILTMKMMLVK